MADVRMPDGQIVTNVPDDMDPDELLKSYSSHLASQPKQKESSIFGAMKQGVQQAFTPEAISELGKRIPPEAAGRMASTARFGTGIARIPANLMKMAGVEGPSEFVKAVDAGAKNLTESAGYTGSGPAVANLGGEMVLGGAALKGASKLAPALEAIPGGAALVKSIKKDPLSQAFFGGAGLGAAGSTGTAYDASKEALLGSAFGAAGQKIASGIGSVAAPQLARYKALKEAGYTDEQIIKDTSIGQFFGGVPQKIEGALKNIPLGGVVPKVEAGIKSLKESLLGKTAPILEQSKTAQNVLGTSQKQAQTLEQRTLRDATSEAELTMNARHAAELAGHKATGADIHIPVLNYILEPLGAKVKPGLVGHDATNEVKTIISDAYNKSLGGMSSIKLPESTKTEMRDLSRSFDFDLGVNAQQFEKEVERLIGQTNNGNWLKPDKWQANLSDLSEKAYGALYGTGNLADKNFGKALYQLKDKWMDLIEGQVGSDLFKAANTAFSRNKIPEKAASYGKSIKAEGQVEPNELINAIRSELSTSRLAGGEDAIQKMATKANKDYLNAKATLEAKQSAEKVAAGKSSTAKADILSDRFTGMENTLAKQKAALQKQAEGNVGKQESLINETIGDKTLGDYVGRRVAYGVGAGSLGMGGYGLSNILGIDPLYAAAIAGGGIGATRGLYTKTAQDLLKQKAIAPRSATSQAIGQTLKANSPVAGLAAAQARQSSAQEDEEFPQLGGGLPVPR